MMFVWHSSNTEESGTALANAIGCEHGLVPPQNYEGDVIVYGGVPAANFNWKGRKFGKIINDPRLLKVIKDKAVLAKKMMFGQSVRVFIVNRAVVKVVKTDGTPIQFWPGHDISNLVAYIHNAVLTDAIFVTLLGSPQIVAVEGIYFGNSFAPSNILLAPAITDHPEVVEAIKNAFAEDDREVLTDIITKATPEELKALRKMMKSIAAE